VRIVLLFVGVDEFVVGVAVTVETGKDPVFQGLRPRTPPPAVSAAVLLGIVVFCCLAVTIRYKSDGVGGI